MLARVITLHFDPVAGSTVINPFLGACPRINIHPSVGVGLSVWMSSLALFCWFESHLNTARGDVPDAVPPTPGLLEQYVMALRGLNRPQGTAIAPQLEQIVPHTYQAPFATHLVQTSQQKTTEPTRLLDLAKYRLYDDLATAV